MPLVEGKDFKCVDQQGRPLTICFGIGNGVHRGFQLLQQSINWFSASRGFTPLNVDGFIGPVTVDALKKIRPDDFTDVTKEDVAANAPILIDRLAALRRSRETHVGQGDSSKTPWWKIAIGATAVLGVGYLVFVRPSIKAGERRLKETRKLASDVGLRSGMTEAEQDRAFDAHYKKKGYPSYLLSTARKVTT